MCECVKKRVCAVRLLAWVACFYVCMCVPVCVREICYVYMYCFGELGFGKGGIQEQ